MVTSIKLPEKKVVKMSDQNSGNVVPQRTLLGEVNEHITCPLCRGYYIDATTIVECLHSFCRSCIIKHLHVKSYCPVCEMMINSAKPNIKPDKALQDIVYKLVPGLFQREMERRQQFYASRPGPAATATPEQRGEDTERVIFSPEDVISFSLEYVDNITDTESISSKSSDSSEGQQNPATSRRYLQCPAVVNISHLKKFISMKFDIDSTQFAIDILYKRVPLPDYYTLMDIAYIYNWKRNEPMRFFYQITDYIAMRSRYGLFDINRNGPHFEENKPSPTPTDDQNNVAPAASSTLPLNKTSADNSKLDDKTSIDSKKCDDANVKNNVIMSKKGNDEDEKSQFLNSFELTAKSGNIVKPMSVKPNKDNPTVSSEVDTKDAIPMSVVKSEDTTLKRKQSPPVTPDNKKIKLEVEKKPSPVSNIETKPTVPLGSKMDKVSDSKVSENTFKATSIATGNVMKSSPHINQTISELHSIQSTPVRQIPESTPLKRSGPNVDNIGTMKCKPSPNDKPQHATHQSMPKMVSPLKLQIPKTDQPAQKKIDAPKPTTKKIPDLKPGIPTLNQGKSSHVSKIRMDLLANNCDPTSDRSKILSQVKTAMNPQGVSQTSGENLRSLFHSCKINIPSSLSITLTDQKLEQKNSNKNASEVKKSLINKNVASVNTNVSHKVPSPPVHNYIEILKLPDSEPKKTNKTDNIQNKSVSSKNDASPKPMNKSEPTSSKGPVPSLKPIVDTKMAKQPNFSSPITFQQTFEQQLQSEKTKLPKNKLQVPKLMPATPKALSAANKLNNAKSNIVTDPKIVQSKSDNVLDLSNPHRVQSQLDLQQAKKLETMQTIVNLAKKHVNPPKVLPSSPSNLFSNADNRAIPSPMRLPHNNSSNSTQGKSEKINSTMHSQKNPFGNLIFSYLYGVMPETSKGMKAASSPSSVPPGISPITYAEHPNINPAPSPRHTRSPSSSPKLVIAEDKQSNP